MTEIQYASKKEIRRKFARDLLSSASASDFEPQELSQLVELIFTELKFDKDKAFKFMKNADLDMFSDPTVLRCLLDNCTMLTFTPLDIIELLELRSMKEVLKAIDDVFEQGLLSLSDSDVRVKVSRFSFICSLAYLIPVISDECLEWKIQW